MILASSAAFVLGAGSTPARADVASDLALYWQDSSSTEKEAYVDAPMPPGVQVIVSELDGPVFADAEGRTLYSWPLSNLRNGDTGDRRNSGISNCGPEVTRVTSGLMSPYPAGLLLPDLDTRKSCEQVWPPFVAPADAVPVGKWNTLTRKDGSKQWTYDGYPLYTSIVDRKPGDVFGGNKLEPAGDGGVVRVPVGPEPNIPPEVAVVQVATGRMLVDHRGYSLYTWDGDEPGKSNCFGPCLDDWSPVHAPKMARPRGDWTVVERSPGVVQWAYKGKPVYTSLKDPVARSRVGSDTPGWHNLYTQRAVTPPEGFTVQEGRIGHVLAGPSGKSVYVYTCRDDAFDQIACDHPDSTQAYRMAICGAGDAKRCLETFPYVIAEPGARSESAMWSVMAIDPNTGHRATDGQPGALHVWAYRGRPVYYFGDDLKPGDTNGDAWGEFNGRRNGYKAFWLRDDFRGNVE